MKVTAVPASGGVSEDLNILNIEKFQLHVSPYDNGTWRVFYNDALVYPEIFEDRDEAIQVMNGLKRDYCRAQEDAVHRAEAIEAAPVFDDDD